MRGVHPGKGYLGVPVNRGKDISLLAMGDYSMERPILYTKDRGSRYNRLSGL